METVKDTRLASQINSLKIFEKYLKENVPEDVESLCYEKIARKFGIPLHCQNKGMRFVCINKGIFIINYNMCLIWFVFVECNIIVCCIFFFLQ